MLCRFSSSFVIKHDFYSFSLTFTNCLETVTPSYLESGDLRQTRHIRRKDVTILNSDRTFSSFNLSPWRGAEQKTLCHSFNVKGDNNTRIFEKYMSALERRGWGWGAFFWYCIKTGAAPCIKYHLAQRRGTTSGNESSFHLTSDLKVSNGPTKGLRVYVWLSLVVGFEKGWA